MTSRYRKCMKKMNYNERGVRRPHTPFTAVFHPSVPVVVFDVQIYGRRSTAVPVRLTVSSPISEVDACWRTPMTTDKTHLVTNPGARKQAGWMGLRVGGGFRRLAIVRGERFSGVKQRGALKRARLEKNAQKRKTLSRRERQPRNRRTRKRAQQRPQLSRQLRLSNLPQQLNLPLIFSRIYDPWLQIACCPCQLVLPLAILCFASCLTGAGHPCQPTSKH
jgi:hypothetical protein